MSNIDKENEYLLNDTEISRDELRTLMDSSSANIMNLYENLLPSSDIYLNNYGESPLFNFNESLSASPLNEINQHIPVQPPALDLNVVSSDSNQLEHPIIDNNIINDYYSQSQLTYNENDNFNWLSSPLPENDENKTVLDFFNRIKISCNKLEECIEKEICDNKSIEKEFKKEIEPRIKNTKNKKVFYIISIEEILKYEIYCSMTLKCDFCSGAEVVVDYFIYDDNIECNKCKVSHPKFICNLCALNRKLKTKDLKRWNKYKDDKTKKCYRCHKKHPLYKFINYTGKSGYKVNGYCIHCSIKKSYDYLFKSDGLKKDLSKHKSNKFNQYKRGELSIRMKEELKYKRTKLN